MKSSTGLLLPLVIAGTVLLAGCTNAPEPVPTGTDTAVPSARASATPAPDPTYNPSAGAQGNRGYFDFVNGRLVAQNAGADGRTLIDNLVSAGFDKSRMEVTPDITAVELKADSVMFSVRFDDGCLIGQLGEKTGYVSQVRPVLGTGRCFIGTTRPIDW